MKPIIKGLTILQKKALILKLHRQCELMTPEQILEKKKQAIISLQKDKKEYMIPNQEYEISLNGNEVFLTIKIIRKREFPAKENASQKNIEDYFLKNKMV